METAIKAELAELGEMVRTAEISDASRRQILWCVDKLPPLYAKFRLTYESRYGDEITRLVQGALNDLVNSKPGCVAAQELAVSIAERLRLFHEQSGIPGLSIKPPRTAPTRAAKARPTLKSK